MEVLLKDFRFLQDALDITIVSILVYYILLWFRGSRAFQLFKGFLFIIVIFALSKWAGLYTIEWLMQRLATILMILLIVVFQPELRRGLERLGRNFFLGFLLMQPKTQDIGIIHKLTRAIDELAEQKLGALFVLERSTGLSEYLESGVTIDTPVSYELLVAVFQKGSPLHDGAVIIQGDRIVGASSLLPLTDGKIVDQKLGTRHRAAIGVSEVTDALAIVLSEERGIVSIAENGVLTSYKNKEEFKAKLLTLFQKEQKDFLRKFKYFFNISRSKNG